MENKRKRSFYEQLTDIEKKVPVELPKVKKEAIDETVSVPKKKEDIYEAPEIDLPKRRKAFLAGLNE